VRQNRSNICRKYANIFVALGWRGNVGWREVLKTHCRFTTRVDEDALKHVLSVGPMPKAEKTGKRSRRKPARKTQRKPK